MIRSLLVLGVLALFLATTAGAAENKDGAVDKEAVNQAIDKGVAFLKQSQRKDGSWIFGKEDGGNVAIGGSSLAGLALLESGVPVKDPVVQNAVAYVRKAVADPEFTFTHSVAAAILLLDRIDDANDALLVKTLAARLLAGQSKDGGWGYYCPTKLTSDVVRRWTTEEEFLKQ